MKPFTEPQDELAISRITQLERISSILIFLIPLVILLICGKSFATKILYLWQVLSLAYIMVYRLFIRQLSTRSLQLKIRRGWRYNRLYRLCWIYLVLSILIMIGYWFIAY